MAKHADCRISVNIADRGEARGCSRNQTFKNTFFSHKQLLSQIYFTQKSVLIVTKVNIPQNSVKYKRDGEWRRSKQTIMQHVSKTLCRTASVHSKYSKDLNHIVSSKVTENLLDRERKLHREGSVIADP